MVHFAATVDKSCVPVKISIRDEEFSFFDTTNHLREFKEPIYAENHIETEGNQGTDFLVLLERLCYARSGDKGNNVNIGSLLN